MYTPPMLDAEEEMEDEESESEEEPTARLSYSISELWTEATALIRKGDCERVIRCVQRYRDLGKASTVKTQRTLLHVTALHPSGAQARIGRALVHHGDAEVDPQDMYGNTPLYYACETGRLRLVRELLKVGADASVQSLSGWTPLMIASANGYHGIVTALLADGHATLEGVEWLYVVNGFGRSAVGLAAEAGQCDVVAQLLAHGAHPALPHAIDHSTPADAIRRRLLACVDDEQQRRLYCAAELLRHYEEEWERGWLLAKGRVLSSPPCDPPLPPPWLQHRHTQGLVMPVLSLANYEEEEGEEGGKRGRRPGKRRYSHDESSPEGPDVTAAVLRHVLDEDSMSQALFDRLLCMVRRSVSGRAEELLGLQWGGEEEGEGGEEKTLDTPDYDTHKMQHGMQAQDEEAEEEEEEEEEEEDEGDGEEEERGAEEEEEEAEEEEQEQEEEYRRAMQENEEEEEEDATTAADSDSDGRMEEEEEEEDDDVIEDSDESPVY